MEIPYTRYFRKEKGGGDILYVLKLPAQIKKDAFKGKGKTTASGEIVLNFRRKERPIVVDAVRINWGREKRKEDYALAPQSPREKGGRRGGKKRGRGANLPLAKKRDIAVITDNQKEEGKKCVPGHA